MPPQPARVLPMDDSSGLRSESVSSSPYASNKHANFGNLVKVEGEEGLWIHLDSKSGRVELQCETCARYRHIHPNCYAPRSLNDIQLLKGGGSGTAVFGGTHPKYGKLVMKHGGAKDTKEVLALAIIRQELSSRHAPEAAEHMTKRIPDFVGVYLTRHHVRDRATELWNTLRGSSLDTLLLATQREQGHNANDSMDNSEYDAIDMHSKSPSAWAKLQRERARSMRDLVIRRGEELGFEVQFKQVVFHIPNYSQDGIITDGFDFLDKLADELSRAQSDYFWKITLAQKTIGGPTSKNGAQQLYDGELKGPLLDLLVHEYVTVIKDLRKLTSDDERHGLHEIQDEIKALEANPDVTKVSKTVDMFCGNAICKNYLPTKGRFAYLRNIARKFHERRFILCDDERLPASFLGYILRNGSDLREVFATPPSTHSVLDYYYDASNNNNNWLDLLKHATSLSHKSATDRIWTCGLTDAGLHNTFLSKERGLELFDLGEPQIVTQPAFLTKFFMSFFHSWGMQGPVVDDSKSSSDSDDSPPLWVHRFEVKSGRLDLTKESRELIPYTCTAFKHVVDAIVRELFDNDPQVKKLLLKYTILQVLSDVAFCLQRWEQKGGGKERFNDRAECLSHWLWRSLWDVYIASYVNKHLLLAED